MSPKTLAIIGWLIKAVAIALMAGMAVMTGAIIGLPTG